MARWEGYRVDTTVNAVGQYFNSYSPTPELSSTHVLGVSGLLRAVPSALPPTRDGCHGLSEHQHGGLF